MARLPFGGPQRQSSTAPSMPAVASRLPSGAKRDGGGDALADLECRAGAPPFGGPDLHGAVVDGGGQPPVRRDGDGADAGCLPCDGRGSPIGVPVS